MPSQSREQSGARPAHRREAEGVRCPPAPLPPLRATLPPTRISRQSHNRRDVMFRDTAIAAGLLFAVAAPPLAAQGWIEVERPINTPAPANGGVVRVSSSVHTIIEGHVARVEVAGGIPQPRRHHGRGELPLSPARRSGLLQLLALDRGQGGARRDDERRAGPFHLRGNRPSQARSRTPEPGRLGSDQGPGLSHSARRDPQGDAPVHPGPGARRRRAAGPLQPRPARRWPQRLG